MSEPKQVYQILPVGEYTVFTGYGDAEKPVTEKAEPKDSDRELFLITTLENILKKLNVGIKKIEPLVFEDLELRDSKKGEIWVKPSMTPLYKLATEINRLLYELRG